MSRSSKNVPLFIIIALLFFVFLAILVNDLSTQNIQSYDVFGLNKIKTQINNPTANDKNIQTQDNFLTEEISEQNNISDTNTQNQATVSQNDVMLSPENTEELSTGDELEVYDEFIEKPLTDIDEELVEEQGQENHNQIIEDAEEINGFTFEDVTPKNNDTIEINKVYTRTLEADSDKFDFYTLDSECDYRIFIKTKINDSPVSGTMKLTVYDERGITIGESNNFWPTYGNTSYYQDEFHFDFNLEKNKKHSLKISNNSNGGDYQVYITTIERDAGASKLDAKQISVGEEVTALLNSSLSDWYVCDVNETGKYEIVLHNIDVDKYIEVTGSYEDSSLFYFDVKCENSYSKNFSIHREGKIYIRLLPTTDMPDGTYIMSIKKI